MRSPEDFDTLPCCECPLKECCARTFHGLPSYTGHCARRYAAFALLYRLLSLLPCARLDLAFAYIFMLCSLCVRDSIGYLGHSLCVFSYHEH